MLNPDVSLAHSINSDNNNPGDQSQVCGLNQGQSPTTIDSYVGCKNPNTNIPPTTFSQVLSYSLSNSLFISDFTVSFIKMSSVGYGLQNYNSNTGSYTNITKAGKLGVLTSIDLNTCFL